MAVCVDVSFTQPELHRALRGVVRVAAGANRIKPIESCVLVRAQTYGCSLSAASGQVAIRVAAEMDVKDGGAVCLPASHLLKITKALNTDAQIRIRVEPSKSGAESVKARLSSGSMTHRIDGFDARVFRQDLTPDDLQWVDFDAGKLLKALTECLPFVIRNDARPNLEGVLFEPVDDRMVFVATDGHRLRVANVQVPEALSASAKWLVPRKGIAELMAALKSIKDVETVRVGFSSMYIIVEVEGVRVQVMLTDATFPDWRQVVPRSTKSDVPIVVDKGLFMSAISRVTAIAEKDESALAVNVVGTSMTLKLGSGSVDTIDVSRELDDTGREIAVGLNHQYLMDALSTFATDQVQMVFIVDELSPVRILPWQEVTDEDLAVIMPLRLP